MAKLASLIDSFTGSTINTSLWNFISPAGVATLDAVNDVVQLAVPTTASALNTFGTSTHYDATSSSLSALITAAANGAGTARTILKIAVDANNSIAIRVQPGTFQIALQTAGTTSTTALPTYSPDAHRWWRLREAAGVWYADFSADGWNWTTLASTPYTWSATAVSVDFQTFAGAAEVAGNTASISHVNTMLGGASNPIWPTVIDAFGPSQTVNGASSPVTDLVSLASRTQGQTSVKRGRQYELDQIQSGTYDVTLADKDGALDPQNTGGPWYGHIRPYQPYHKHAQWPPTVNLLTQLQATGGDLGVTAGLIPASASILSSTDSTGGSVVASGSAWQGGNVLQFAVPISTAAGVLICGTGRVAPDLGQAPATSPLPVSQQLHVRNVTASTTVSVAAALSFYNAAGTLLSTTVGSTTTLTGGTAAAWTTVTVSASAPPAGTAYMVAGVQTAATAAAAAVVQVDGWQVEAATAPSAWVAPGTWYPIYAGFVERWPSSWDMGGTYGTVAATAVDALSMLSQVTLSDPLSEEIQTRNPRFLYTLGDPSGSVSATDSTGNNPAIPVASGKYGTAPFTFGNDITSATAGGVYTGGTGTVATAANPSPGAAANAQCSFLSLNSAGILGPATVFSRMIAFRYTGAVPTAEADIWTALDNRHGTTPSGMLRLYLDNTGKPNLVISSFLTGALTFTGPASVADGNWHLAIFGYSQAGKLAFLSIDGSYTSVDPTAGGGNYLPLAVVSDNVGAWVDATTHATNFAFAGDLSYITEFPAALTATDCTELYTAWQAAAAGESSDARYARILRYAGYTGTTSLQPGLTTNMGPATDLSGTDALSACQAVVDTENGDHFVARDGSIVFQSRGNRYNSRVPVYTFGENTAGGEWPYEDCQLDYDPTHLANTVQVTQQSTNQVFSAQDTTSIGEYFPRTLTRTVNAAATSECQDAAGYLVSRYKQPLVRVDTLKLHPSAFPAMWPVCLSLELGMRVRVMRRPPAPAATIQVDCFIESIQVDMDDTGEAIWTLQCSPVDPLTYGNFASFHTALNTAVTAGASSIVINAGQDNTNPASTQLAPGQHLVLGQGTATPETVVIQSVSATTAGWTTATITLTAPTVASHAVGAVVCEPLPAGTTDPTTWDSVARFDSINFSY